MNRLLFVSLSLSFVTGLGACSSEDDVTKPSENPPDPWGAPISGGTVTVTKSNHAVIADPDRDRIVTVDLSTREVGKELALSGTDEPGRVIEDSVGRLHVALRRGGALLTLDGPTTLAQVARRGVCAEPRGVAYDAATDKVHVACTTGELVTLPSAGGDATRVLRLDRDLRDVVVAGNQLVVTKFRSAETITLDATGTEISRVRPPDVMRIGGFFDDPAAGGDGSGAGSGGLVPAIAAVAWRAVSLGDGRIAITHQRAHQTMLGTSPGGYGPGCGGNNEAAVSIVQPGATPTVRAVDPISTNALPVDIAASPDGSMIALAYAGSQEYRIVRMAALGEDDDDDDQCPQEDPQKLVAPVVNFGLGAPTSVAFTPDNQLVVFYPELPAIVLWSREVGPTTIRLPGNVGYDAGRAMFHQQGGVGLACASCHPEGRDDGLVWKFDVFGDRRTQSLAGGITKRGPYHWGGDMPDLATLMTDVFGGRMLGGEVTRSQKLSLGPWLDRIPAPAGIVVDADAVARGAVIFESRDANCTGCHSGSLLTNNELHDVGTGGPIKVPSLLGVGARAPFMHTGCATDLAARFDPACGGGETHGKTAHLSVAQLADLVAYLESL